MAKSEQGIRGIRQVIPSGFAVGRQTPGSTKGQPGLVPLPPTTQQAIISGAGGKATSGGGVTGFGTIASGSVTTVLSGTGINVTGGPAYTVNLITPVTVLNGGTGATTSGAALDNIGPFSSNGILSRTGAGTYTVLTDPLSVGHGGTGAAIAGTSLDNIGPFAANGYLRRTGAGAYTADAAGQILGEPSTGNASAGNVGEYVAASVAAGSALALTTATAKDITSISLTAGDWDVTGLLGLRSVGTETITLLDGWTNSASVTLPNLANTGDRVTWAFSVVMPAGTNDLRIPVGTTRFNFSTTTTVFLSTNCTFSGGTSLSGYGRIEARRAR